MLHAYLTVFVSTREIPTPSLIKFIIFIWVVWICRDKALKHSLCDMFLSHAASKDEINGKTNSKNTNNNQERKK